MIHDKHPICKQPCGVWTRSCVYIAAPTLCLQLIPQAPHKPAPEVEGQLSGCSCSAICLQLQVLHLTLKVVKHGRLQSLVLVLFWLF
jgi:hypothetical protein